MDRATFIEIFKNLLERLKSGQDGILAFMYSKNTGADMI